MKYARIITACRIIASHPTGVRGLKFTHDTLPDKGMTVAPHWGAWIEIRFGRCRKRM